MASRKDEKAATGESTEPKDAAPPAGSSSSSEARQDQPTAFQEERKILLDK